MTTLYSNKYYKSLPYTVKLYDTLESIKSQYTYIPHWEVIAEFNNLDYPYIVSAAYTSEANATGSVKFTKEDSYVGDLYIPENTIVSYDNYYFKTTEEALIPIDEDSISDVAIEAVESGNAYNLDSGLITVINTTSIYTYATVVNTSSITGGYKYNVVKPGDVIYIPTQDYFSLSIQSKTNYSVEYGIDIKVKDNLYKDSYGLFEESSSTNLILTAGMDNLSQSLVRRLTTEKGSLVKHPDYGSDLITYLGLAQDYELPELLRIEAERTILTDPRVESVEDIEVDYQGAAAVITCRVIAKSNDEIFLTVNTGQRYEGD